MLLRCRLDARLMHASNQDVVSVVFFASLDYC
jgi:hypothetical protein